MGVVFSRRALLLGVGASALGAVSGPLPVGSLATPSPGVALTSASTTFTAERAAAAEAAVVDRYVGTLWGLPGHATGLLTWPAPLGARTIGRWCYWWQAHLLDCAVDAAIREPNTERTKRIRALAAGIRARNFTGWTNRYYDDMAWLVLALDRAQGLGADFANPVGQLMSALRAGWSTEVGAVPWRTDDNYYNTPATGPAGVAFARTGDLALAEKAAEFLHTRLRDPETGLIADGIHHPDGRINHTRHTYNQGVALGLYLELATRTGQSTYLKRIEDLVAAIAENLTTPHGVIVGAAGNDEGLFMGILARYLADVARVCGDTTAAAIVTASAEAAWAHRVDGGDGHPLFGTEWARPASMTNAAHRDLSVQLSGWMVLEAHHRMVSSG
ncbi:hypothetical protein GCM10011591_04650 [Nocardia camponoti]|uniref:Fructose-bisphosphate aldolase n=1 Tax=Nocardia camponoti TaxID=1616106 RepID=A0A917Q9F2_9NOCA|nr:hypothetical protein GCM10011591_04650 [Nocardia camponoti]